MSDRVSLTVIFTRQDPDQSVPLYAATPTLNPEQIILFGSHAYGEPNEDSDIDLLVIVSQSNEPRYRRSRLAYRALRGIGVSKDILVMTRAEVERKANVTSRLRREFTYHLSLPQGH